MSTHKAPELLLPAGGLDKMRAAYDFGADAVYAGQPRYSLRARNNEFKLQQLEQGIQEAKARGKKFFVTSNLLAHNDKVRTYLRDIEPVVAMQPDALIMADPGLIMMVLDKMHSGAWNHVPIHLSVQANTTNYATVKFWQKVGVTRIILSRELSLDEIEAIRNECPDMELEVFVHGALCIAYSGRCLLSGYFNRRDPNQGTCTNACRWNYTPQAGSDQNDAGEVQPDVEIAGRGGALAEVHRGHRVMAKDPGRPRNPHRLRDLGPDRRRDRHVVAGAERVVHRHLPPLDGVRRVAIELVGEVAERVPPPERHARLIWRGRARQSRQKRRQHYDHRAQAHRRDDRDAEDVGERSRRRHPVRPPLAPPTGALHGSPGPSGAQP